MASKVVVEGKTRTGGSPRMFGGTRLEGTEVTSLYILLGRTWSIGNPFHNLAVNEVA